MEVNEELRGHTSLQFDQLLLIFYYIKSTIHIGGDLLKNLSYSQLTTVEIVKSFSVPIMTACIAIRLFGSNNVQIFSKYFS